MSSPLAWILDLSLYVFDEMTGILALKLSNVTFQSLWMKAIGSSYSSEDAEVVGANGDKTIIAKIDATRIVVSLELLAMSLGHNLVIYWFLQRSYS